MALIFLKKSNTTPTIADISPSACRYSTILLLCAGSTRANNLALITAALWSSGPNSSNSRPVNEVPSVDSDSLNTPILRQIASAVAYEQEKNTDGHYHIYCKYSDRQAWANSVHPDEMPQNVASHQGLHCLPLIQKFIDTTSCRNCTCSKFRTSIVRNWGVQILRVNAVIPYW